MPTDIGIIDLQMGFPLTSVEEKRATYDFFRPLLKDTQSARDFEFPAQYMFKQVPDIVDPETDVVEWDVAKMDEFGIAVAQSSASRNGIEARRRYPDRFVLQQSVNPNEGIEGLWKLEQAKADYENCRARSR